MLLRWSLRPVAFTFFFKLEETLIHRLGGKGPAGKAANVCTIPSVQRLWLCYPAPDLSANQTRAPARQTAIKSPADRVASMMDVLFTVLYFCLFAPPHLVEPNVLFFRCVRVPCCCSGAGCRLFCFSSDASVYFPVLAESLIVSVPE